ncbi:hypothetical protein AB0N24_04935 [Arthrobacter sp. NPDC093128]|uniref:hypothetical protein n=1 Tax=Arthrobacter sp. NPDC093128 TaxID=3154979 RepID=UPI00343313C8
MGPSGLDPSGGFELPDVDSLDTAAADLTTHSAAFQSGLDAAAQTWSGLGSSYVSEESPTVLAAFSKVPPLAARVSSDAQLTSKALTTFSSTCRDLRQRLEAYGRSVRELDTDIDVFPTSVEKKTMVKDQQITTQVQQHWSGDADLTGRRNALAAEVQAIHNDYLNAQDTCAAAMAAVSGAEVHRSERLQHTDLRSGNWITEGLFNAGTLFGIQNDQDQNPWGQQTVPYRPNGVLGELYGFGAGAVMLVDGVWSLLPVLSNKAKNDGAMAGLRTLATTDPRSVDWGAVGAGIIHAEDAETNAGWAAGANVFGLASLLVPALGVGKAGTVASKAGSVAEKISIATTGRLSAGMGSAAQGLYSTGAFLSKPGSLALKVSDLVMPQTTVKVMDTITAMKVNAWMALDKLPAAVDHAATRASDGLATVLRATDQALDQAFPKVAPAGISSGLGQGPLGRMADSLSSAVPTDHLPGGGRAPAGHVPGTATTTPVVAPVEHFPKPETIERTITLERGHRNFPVSVRDNFAARTGLEPNTEYVVEHRSRMNHVTGKAVDSVEKYYTDATGRVVRVDTYAGIRGAWSPELNKPVPNVTYNVVAKVDGGLDNTFTYTTDAAGHAQRVSGRITSTFAGDMNRNAWQQLLAGKRVGGLGYEGGHSAPSFLGAPGERIGLFAQHQFQNRGAGDSNISEGEAKFFEVENRIRDDAKKRLQTGKPLDLKWAMSTPSGGKPGLPDTFTLTHWFDDEVPERVPFNNLMK